jgi:hypothetical protein
MSFFIFESKFGDRLGYRCACCHLFTVFPDGETPRVFHCSRWSEYQPPKPTLWDSLFGRSEDLPRVKPQAPPLILRRRQTEEDIDLQQC